MQRSVVLIGGRVAWMCLGIGAQPKSGCTLRSTFLIYLSCVEEEKYLLILSAATALWIWE